MKQTNNAIKFLLAQYRAIFKHAYLKGLVSAAVLTAGLATGAANAQIVNDGILDHQDFTNSNADNGSASEKITKGSYINLSDSNNWSGKFEAGSGSAYAGSVTLSGSGAAVNVTGAKDSHLAFTDLTIQNGASFSLTNNGNDANTHIYGYKSGAGASGNEGTFTVDNSTVSLSKASIGFNKVEITSGSTITLGGNVNGVHSNGEWYMYSNIGAVTGTTSGSMNITDSTVNLNDQSNLNVSTSGTMTIQGNSTINFNGTSKTVASGDNYATAFLYANQNSGSIIISGSSTDPAKTPTLNVKDGAYGAIYSNTLNVSDATINIGSGATMILDGDWSDTTVANEGNHSGSTITLSGSVDVNNANGTLIIGNSANGSTVNVNGDVNIAGNIVNHAQITVSGTNANLGIDLAQLERATDTGLFATSGSVMLQGSGTFTILGTSANKVVDLADLNISGSGSVVTSEDFTVSGTATIAGDYLAVSNKLQNSAGSDAGVDTSLSIKATNLSLGGGANFVSASNGLGFKSAEARNVVFNRDDANTTAFSLQNDLTLRSITSDKNIVVGEEGSINGEVILSGSSGNLTVDGGIYTASEKITINGGTLTVQNTGDGSNLADVSSLTVNNLVIDLSSAATIKVDGGLTGAYDPDDINHTNDKLTKLDLSNGFTITGDNSNSGAFVITSGGVAVVDANSVQKVIDTVEASGNNSGAILFQPESGGLLSIDGGLSLEFNDTNAIALSKVLEVKEGGILEAESLDITANFKSNGNSTDNGLGFTNGTVRVDNLSLNNLSDVNGKEAEVAYLTGGDFVISNKLSSKDVVTLASSNSVKGSGDVAVIFQTAEANGSGTIEAKGIKIESDSGEVSIAQGNWSAGATNFEIAKGSMNVGSLDDKNEVDGIASLTAGGLTATAGNLNVYKGSSATFDTLNQTGTNITVNGKLTINGEVSGEGTSKVWGANTTGGTITVAGNDAVLTLGSTALGGMSLDGDTIKYANGDTFTNNITLSGFGTLELAFADTKMKFTEEGLKNLRKEFISGNNGEVLQAGYIDIGAAKIDGVTVNEDGTISWNNLEKISDIIADIKQDDLSTATLVDVDGSDVVNANVGNIKADGSTQTVNVGQTTLNKANDKGYFITNKNGDLVSANVKEDGTFGLYNGGQIKDVTLEAGVINTTTLNVVASGEAVTTINSIKGGANTLVNIDGTTVVNNNVDVENLNVNQKLTVAKDVTLTGDLTSTKDVTTGKITARELNVDGETTYSGDLELAGNSTFTGYAYLGGNNTFNGNTVSFKSGANLDHGITTAKNIFVGDGTDAGELEITGNAQVTADIIESSSSHGVVLTVGEEAGSEGDESWDSSAGFLTVGRLDLDGGELRTDPEYGKSATIVAVGSFGDKGDYDKVKGNEAGNLDGQIIALRNSIVGIGVTNNDDAKAIAQLQDTFSRYLDANGSLNGEKVGSVVYVAKALDVENATSKIIVDSNKSFSDYESAINAGGEYAKKIYDNNIYLGNNSVLAVSDHAALDSKADTTQRPAIGFTYTTGDGEASLYAEKDAKIVLVGDGFSSRDTVYLFDDNNNDGIMINGNSVTVETINGLLHFTLEAGKETKGGDLTLNRDAVNSAFSMASAPVKYSLISYAANDNNWEDTSINHKVEELHGDVASGISTDDNGKTFYKTGDANKTAVEGDYVAIASTDANGNTTYNVYHDAYNYFLDDVVRNSTTGLAAEQAARLAVYGGAAQAALTAGATTYDAISGRMGVGAQTGSITFADNGQGAGLWVSPVYKNHDSDGFGAQGASYGVDMDLYGVALGGDFTMANGLRVGAAFNVGSGDADGQGTGNGVTNDFDYYGFAVYGGFSYDKFSVVGDISYTVVDNDVEANTEVEKISASMDSTNLSVGVTGQYTFNYAGMDIVPHAGLRYTNVDLDDYNVKGSGDIAHFNADSFNVFSIPVGVTISKEIIAGEWTILPAFDVTLTANMGDDSVEGSVAWAGINNMTTKIESEVIDSFTYGATLGVSAKTGNLSLGFGVNYTGASSADEYGVGANARFVF